MKKANLAEDFQELYSLLSKNDTPTKLLQACIEVDDLSGFQTMLGDFPKINPKTLNFRKDPTNRNELSNILTFAINCQSEKVAHYIVEHDLVAFDGTIPNKQSFPNKNKNLAFTIHPLNEALDTNNYPLYETIFKKLVQTELSNSSSFNNNLLNFLDIEIKPRDSYTLTRHFDQLLQNENPKFLNLVTQSLEELINKNETAVDRNRYVLPLVKTTLSSKAPLKTIFATLKVLLPFYEPQEKNLPYNFNILGNHFFSNVYSSKRNDIEGNYDTITNTLKLLKEHNLFFYTNDMAFQKPFFQNKEIYHSIVNTGISLTENKNFHGQGSKINLLDISITHLDIDNNYPKLTPEKIEKIQEDKKYILPDIRKRIGDGVLFYNLGKNDSKYGLEKTYNLVENAVKNRKFEVLDVLSNDDLYRITGGYAKFCDQITIHSPNDQLLFENFLQRCIDANISFFTYPTESKTTDGIAIMDRTKELAYNQDHPFYDLLKFNINHKLLDQILKQENQTISQLSNNPHFWQFVLKEDMAQYVYDRGANYDNPESLLKLCYGTHPHAVDLYLKFGGSPEYKDSDDGSVLHYLIKDKKYEQAQTVVSYYPELVSTVNKHNKFPVSYLMVDLNKKCLELKKNPDSKNESIKTCINLAFQIFKAGLKSYNKKPLKTLQNQFQQYDAISEYQPDLITAFNYGVLQANLVNKGTTKKRLKI